ncbi:MAG: hypothetical protein Q9220_002750 [cf. Caloplaca sp. 1 TL-2023]
MHTQLILHEGRPLQARVTPQMFLSPTVLYRVDQMHHFRAIVRVERLHSRAGSQTPKSRPARYAEQALVSGTESIIFIVQPPQDVDQASTTSPPAGVDVVDLTEDDDVETPAIQRHGGENDTPQSPVLQIDPALGGGQEVRLCNPCVPDPNPLPHLPFESPGHLGLRSFPMPDFTGPRAQSNDLAQPPIPGLPRRSSSMRHSFHLPEQANRGMTVEGSHNSSGNEALPQRHHIPPYVSRHTRRPSDVPPSYGSVPNPSLHERHRHHASTSTVPDSRYRSISDLNAPLPPRPLPLQRQPILREEDECPICHQALPPKGPNGSETVREAHVADCIQQHFSSSVPRSARPPPSVATDAAVAATAASTTQTEGSPAGNPAQDHHERRDSENTGQGSSSSNGNAFQRMGSQRRRVAGMLVYLATEKDCLGEGGEAAECVICFEEFEQGVEMGRLECLFELKVERRRIIHPDSSV